MHETNIGGKALPHELDAVVRREKAVAQLEVEKPLLSPEEFGESLHGVIGRNSLYGLLGAGRIKHIRVGRKILIPRSELTDFPAREVA